MKPTLTYPPPNTKATLLGLISSPAGGCGGYRYSFNGFEKDDKVKGVENHISFGDYGYDTRLARRWNRDPVSKPHESSYAAFANNPIWFVDVSGEDSLIVHAKMYKSASGGTYIFKLTFSVIQNGIETVVQPELPEGATGIYLLVPAYYYEKGNNSWYNDGNKDGYFPIRFTYYEYYTNSIRLKYVSKNSSIRILAHTGYASTASIGCNVATCDVSLEDTNIIEGEEVIPTFETQEALDAIKELYDTYVPSETGKDEYGRDTEIPTQGNDFLMRPNSTAKMGKIPMKEAKSVSTGSKPDVTMEKRQQP